MLLCTRWTAFYDTMLLTSYYVIWVRYNLTWVRYNLSKDAELVRMFKFQIQSWFLRKIAIRRKESILWPFACMLHQATEIMILLWHYYVIIMLLLLLWFHYIIIQTLYNIYYVRKQTTQYPHCVVYPQYNIAQIPGWRGSKATNPTQITS